MEGKCTKLTVGERILMLLLNYTRYRGEMQVPVDVTQDGIALNLGIIRSAVPRAVGSLINKGHVDENLAHIDKMSRRRKVYMLTDPGINAAKALLEELGALKIDVIDHDSRKKELLSNLLSAGKVTLKNISDVVSSSKLDLTKAGEEAEGRRKRTSYIHSLSPPEIFLDREREIAEISESLRSKKRRVTVVYGIAGVGKTTLSWKITQIFSKDMNVFYIDLKEWTTLPYVLKEFSNFLAQSGWRPLQSYLESEKEPHIESVCELLKTLPPEVPLLLIFDDLHRAPGDVNQFLISFKEVLPFARNVHLIVLSRTRATFYDVRDVRISGLVGELELLGFDRETSRKFLVERGFAEDEVEAVIERTGGHPLALVLVEKEGLNLDVEDFDHFLKEEIFSKLSPDRIRLLGLLSLSRLQLGESELISMIEVDKGAMAALMDQHLVFGTPSGYMIHDLIKDQAVQALPPQERERCHRALSDLFHDKLSSLGFHQDIGREVPPFPFGIEDETGLGAVPLFASEEVHHLLGAGRAPEAMDVLIKATMQIPSKELVKEQVDLVLSRLKRSISGNVKSRKDFLQMLLDILEGKNDRALARMERLSRMKPSPDDLSSSIRMCCRLWLPYIEDKVRGPRKALEALENIGIDEVPERLRYYFMVTRASLHYKMGDHAGASSEYRKLLDTILQNQELPVQLREAVEEAIQKAQGGSIQAATDHFQKILNLTSANRDILREEMPYVDVDHHLLSAIYSLYHFKRT